ncbi:MAG: ribosome silencing factor [Peptoniphilaceae bacterium]|nr:ribosome silencing factor [Peptoniphilaceae bacterium]MDD7433891.1 ribosome silencing factor [Peptoniphilaceae bacterium]MDY3075200.1 ribosome silencing factor [Peptoniphilaceae bacterium]MDY3986654.1 ribosome silencing factor [Peptoniphilaceae bacterium]MDY5841449.1 ribosome silencing factor [Peptoniphilaceae bacterium]
MENQLQQKMTKNELIIKTAENKLAQDIRLIPIEENAGISDYFLVMTGRNKIHTQAIADAIEDALYKNEMPPRSVEGFREGTWILMDCEETIVHIFTGAERKFYDLEGLWS